MDCISILEELKNNEDQGQDGIDFDSRNSRVGGDIVSNIKLPFICWLSVI